MAKERKTVYVNDRPISIFLWAEVQHCVNAFDTELFLDVQAGRAEIVDEKGGRIGWGGFAGDGQHIYVRPIQIEPSEASPQENPQWIDQLINIYKSEPPGNPPQSIWRYTYKGHVVYFIPKQAYEMYSKLFDADGNEICAPDGGSIGTGDGRCPDFFMERTDEILIWRDTRADEQLMD